MQTSFTLGSDKDYPKSFSCGILEVPKGHGELPIEDIIQEVDHTMYKQKLLHKKIYKREL